MQIDLQNQLAFFLTGRRSSGSEPRPSAIRPALFARYRDLTELRYDFPLVIAHGAPPEKTLRSLSRMVDDAALAADETDRLRLARHGQRIERAVRKHLAAKGPGDFATVWHSCASELATEDAVIGDSAMTLWNSFATDGDILDADAAMPARVVKAAWNSVQAEKAKQFNARTARLLHALKGILLAEDIGGGAGRSPERLRSAVGSSFAGAFDFNELSRILVSSKPASALSDSRRDRINQLIAKIEGQKFYTESGESIGFVFDNCADAVRSHNERRAEAVELLRALAIAELEAAGNYREKTHDVLFENYGRSGLELSELGQLPDYLICTDGGAIDVAETARIGEVLAAGLPFKILVRTDDVLEPSVVAEGHVALGLRSRQIVDASIGLTDVLVLQAAASRLFANRARLLSGLSYDGPALFSVFSGANGHTGDFSPYLVAAAAVESRVFPTISYDPSAGGDWASRLDISDNPSTDDDWPVHRFAFEDADLQSNSESLPFTPADFTALDDRFARHYSVADDISEAMIPVDEALRSAPLRDRVPYTAVVGEDLKLRRALIDNRLLREAERCRAMWHSLQELAGIHNSHAERLLAAERKRAESAPAPDQSPVGGAPVPEIVTAEPETVAAEPSSDDPYIETSRCTSCNECTNVNPKVFAYNDNKQAYIADADAGTYRQLVEAAEGCQVGIIHPGKPRNPKEPGLDDLLARAQPFL